MRLYGRYFGIQIRSQMQHKMSFFMTILGQLLTSFTAFLGVYYMFDRFNSVEGFTYNEVLLCLASVLMSFSLAECFFRGFDMFPSVISNGEFDRMMVRPRGVMFQILASKIEFSRLGRFLQALVIFCYAIPACGVVWTGDKILTLAMMVICGVLLFAGLFIMYASICFFTLDGLEFMNIFTDGGREFGSYPFSIYGSNVLKFLTFVIPLALVQYYPLLYILGRSNNLLYMFAPLGATLFLLPAFAFWRFGIRHFKSTGS